MITTYEGLDYLNNAGLRGGTPITQWYVILFEADYTPTKSDKMSTFLASATEITAVEGATRVPINFDASVNGTISNDSSPVEIVLTEAKTARGIAIVSAPAKGASTGILLAAGRFTSPKQRDIGEAISVIAGLTDLCS